MYLEGLARDDLPSWAARAEIGPGPERKETMVTIKQLTSTAAALPAAATAAAGTLRGRLILLAIVVLVLLAGVVLAVTALSPSAPPPLATNPTNSCTIY